MSELLDQIRTPEDLKRLPVSKLSALADEMREIIIEVVRRRGGHLASNLGIAELTIALHYVFDFAHDRLLWDVGHQCYAHKLLTGRREAFERLRQRGGASGFPDPEESPYDLFKVGHAGTAISTAVGMALADRFAGNQRKVVAVVGDASIVNGLSLEAMNNAPLVDRQLLVVLNDNSMAIDVTQGAMARALDRVRLTRTYRDFKHATDNMLRHLPMGHEIGDALRHLHQSIRTAVHGQQAFEALGFRYFGPVDGHDAGELVDVLRRVSEVETPVLLHMHTEKGRGCDYAVEDPTTFHSPGGWTEENGRVVFARSDRPSWTSTFAQALIDRAGRDERVVAITAAMPDGTGLRTFREAFPERCFDVGISESHAVAMAGGMARDGRRPVVAIYSTFMQRGFDQTFQEIALQGLPVLLCMDRAGLVGSDGAVHHGFLDIAFLRGLPGMVLMAPAEQEEMGYAIDLALSLNGPAAIRYPRDQVPLPLAEECPPFELGRARVLREGEDAALLCYGTSCEPAVRAAEALQADGVTVKVVNARFAKPLDEGCIGDLLNAGCPVLTCEDHAGPGGFGAAVLELANERGWPTGRLHRLHLPDRFVGHASRSEQLREVGLDAEGIERAVRAALNGEPVGAISAAESQGR